MKKILLASVGNGDECGDGVCCMYSDAELFEFGV